MKKSVLQAKSKENLNSKYSVVEHQEPSDEFLSNSTTTLLALENKENFKADRTSSFDSSVSWSWNSPATKTQSPQGMPHHSRLSFDSAEKLSKNKAFYGGGKSDSEAFAASLYDRRHYSFDNSKFTFGNEIVGDEFDDPRFGHEVERVCHFGERNVCGVADSNAFSPLGGRNAHDSASADLEWSGAISGASTDNTSSHRASNSSVDSSFLSGCQNDFGFEENLEGPTDVGLTGHELRAETPFLRYGHRKESFEELRLATAKQPQKSMYQVSVVYNKFLISV